MQDQSLTLLCLSHLNWDHVWQRPQQLMARFSKRCRVIYVDPPEVVETNDQPYFQPRQGVEGVEVIRPIFAQQRVDDSELAYEQLWLELLPELLANVGENTILWVFSPRADYLVEAALPHVRLSVYDCMDDLASFRDGSDVLRQRERRLMSLVKLVFTGGHSMYEARKNLHPHVHSFPSGVDIEHYRQVANPALSIPAQVASIPQPRLGYFGVLDERIDWELIAAIAERRPQWQWVLVGPTAKVDSSELPLASNIHYLGQQHYSDLPAFLKSFDVATMPFALNEATRYISPTKTLEYLAGGKPVISSSVPDVVAFYSRIVMIADGVDAWIDALEATFTTTVQQRSSQMEQVQPILERSTWDSIAARMWSLMNEQLV